MISWNQYEMGTAMAPPLLIHMFLGDCHVEMETNKTKGDLGTILEQNMLDTHTEHED